MAMPAAMRNYLNQKYAILNREADIRERQEASTSEAARAQAMLDQVRARLMPRESKANIGLTEAQTGLTGVNTDIARVNLRYLPRRSEAEIAGIEADTRVDNAQGQRLENRNFGFMPGPVRNFGFNPSLEMGSELESDFRKGGGGFYSFGRGLR